jgi:hypothetical protein
MCQRFPVERELAVPADNLSAHLRQLSDPDVMPSSDVQIDTFVWTKIGVLV